jgi:hypothetical protein
MDTMDPVPACRRPARLEDSLPAPIRRLLEGFRASRRARLRHWGAVQAFSPATPTSSVITDVEARERIVTHYLTQTA